MGYITAKYGLDIFSPALAVKGIKILRELKRANTLLTLEQIASSTSKGALVLEESAKKAALRAGAIAEAVKKGKILVKNKNVARHVMQPKHTWDKLIKLTGNVEEDFKKVIILLEENNVLNKKKFKAPLEVNPGILRYDYEILINGEMGKLIFTEYLKTAEFYLTNAWVVTK